MSGRADDISADWIEVTDATPSRSRSIDDLRVGMTVVQKFAFGLEQLDQFKQLANDRAPIHSNPDVAQRAGFDAPIIQGLALATRFSRLIGMYLPGERAILERIELHYRRPVYADHDLLYSATIQRIFRPMRVVTLALSIAENDILHVDGHARCRLL